MLAVTGAAGFIGSNLVRTLADAGHSLTLVDHPLTGAKVANLANLARFRFLEHEPFLDWLSHHRPVLHGIFHLGACSRTTETDWGYLERNNLHYSQALWTWCTENSCPFIYASSAATYGDGSLGFDDRLAPEQLRPLNLYAKSKNDFDAWVLEQVRQNKATPPKWAGLKFFNVYGPAESHKGSMASVVWQAYQQILTSGEVRLFRSNTPEICDGGQRRDFVHVRDCIRHMLWLWQQPTVSGLYNSGTGVARTFSDLALAVFAALGRKPLIRFVDMPAGLSAQYQNYTQADMSKLRSLGFSEPSTSLEAGVAQTIAWLESRKAG